MSEYRLLRNVNNPIVILGLPLILAYVYLGVILFSVMLFFILTTLKVGIVFQIATPVGIFLVGIVGIKRFYKKHGINGFHQQRRDKAIANNIDADMSAESILNQKASKNEIK